MINRRNIRIKVLHTIFENKIQLDDQLDYTQASKSLEHKFNQTEALTGLIWHMVVRLSDYVLIYANAMASKRLPTYEDLHVNVKLSDNIIVQQLKSNLRLANVVKKNHLHTTLEDDMVRTLFYQFKESEAYQQYLLIKERSVESEKKIIEQLIEQCIFRNEITMSFLSENYISLESEIDMVESWTEKIIFGAKNFNFEKLVTKDKYDFAFDLLKCYYEKKEIVFNLIEPKLINWDADRVAILDLIVLHLGICEMLFFESIPLKVTINEYIDLAKSYSGMQSGQFVNGLLDNVKKELLENNQIHKIDYKETRKSS